MDEKLDQVKSATEEKESMQEVFDSLTDKQKELIFTIVGKAIEKSKAKSKHRREKILG